MKNLLTSTHSNHQFSSSISHLPSPTAAAVTTAYSLQSIASICSVGRIVVASLFLLALPTTGFTHCQIPCGIYHDDIVFSTLEQNIETLQKAVHELSGTGLSINQSVRWVINKENQSDQIAQTMLTYFLQQRVKTDDPKRAEKLNLIAMICMQCTKVKQTTDSVEVDTLGKEIGQLKELSGIPISKVSKP
ncbi:MAG: hypothetical protein A3F67_09950 [Verrucomicrobia bacterium RIFCSPHIGHO2_12_FULL_41_10]|nr:MAG: hypothetical protein A3F67_09950 [Verrucomicrobia bacterium RIFCSPHIGHO2_12_FULL_41_10]HLB32769.1 superoxide dismutase [Ni] [Chthoniobacterales bacterium]